MALWARQRVYDRIQKKRKHHFQRIRILELQVKDEPYLVLGSTCWSNQKAVGVHGKYLGIGKLRDNFKDFSTHYARPRSQMLGDGLTSTWSGMLGGGKNPYGIFINLDGVIEMAASSNNSIPVALVP